MRIAFARRGQRAYGCATSASTSASFISTKVTQSTSGMLANTLLSNEFTCGALIARPRYPGEKDRTMSHRIQAALPSIIRIVLLLALLLLLAASTCDDVSPPPPDNEEVVAEV